MISQGGTTRDSYIAEVESEQTFKPFDICLKFSLNFRYRCSVLSLFHFTIEAAVWLSYWEQIARFRRAAARPPYEIMKLYGSRIVANAHLLRNSHNLFSRKADHRGKACFGFELYIWYHTLWPKKGLSPCEADSWRFFMLTPLVDLSIKL